jgi:nucleoside-diphosphate-sugar epimerase
MEGDLAQPMLGLSSQDYSSLVQRVGVIVHCAAATSWTASYIQLRGANVTATQNILQLVMDGQGAKPKRLCHISTLSAAFTSVTTPRQDSASYAQATREYVSRVHGSASAGQGYPVSKMVAESLVRKCGQEFNVPYTIIRPGTISAHSVTGFSNWTDFTTRLISSIKRSGICPIVDASRGGSIDLACVDFVAEVIKRVVMLAPYTGSTVHVCNEQLTSFSSILAALASPLGGQVPALTRVPAEDWEKHVAGDSDDPLNLLSRDLLSVLCTPSSSSASDAFTDTSRTFTSSLTPGIAMTPQQSSSCPPYDPRIMIPLVLKWLESSSSEGD